MTVKIPTSRVTTPRETAQVPARAITLGEIHVRQAINLKPTRASHDLLGDANVI
jgi:hypothetical protein